MGSEPPTTRPATAEATDLVWQIHDAIKAEAIKAGKEATALPWWRFFSFDKAAARAVALLDGWELVLTVMSKNQTEDVKAKCPECKFFEDDFMTPTGGICRRRSPSVVDGVHGAYTKFPRVLDEDWCGEFKSKTTTQQEPPC